MKRLWWRCELGVCEQRKAGKEDVGSEKRWGQRWEGSQITRDLAGVCSFPKNAGVSLRGFKQGDDRI